jgi:hypothetical protein
MMQNPAWTEKTPGVTYIVPMRQPPKILELHWHIGETLPEPLNAHNKHLIVTVQADGDELFAIFNQFDNLPSARDKRVQTWRGEFAQFIVDNLIPLK